MERLEKAKRLRGGLAALTAAIVGVIANVSLWFALHVLFVRVSTAHAGSARILLPDLSSFDWRAGLLASIAALLIFRVRLSVFYVLPGAALGGFVLGGIA